MNFATSLDLSLRNLAKNRRRSAYTIVAVGLGFAAVNVFGGFTDYIFDTLEETHIYSRGYGHISVFQQGYFDDGHVERLDYLLTEPDVSAIRQAASGVPGVALVTTQLQITGMISDGEVSTVFYGMGRRPSELTAMRRQARGVISDLRYFAGEPLRDEQPTGVGLARGLAAQMNLDVGASAILIAATIDGQINALDVDVAQLFSGTESSLSNAMMVVPLDLAQSLYETTSVDRVNILLSRDADLQETLAILRERFAAAGLAVDTRGWTELAIYYQRTRDMLDMFFLILFAIVLAIVIMSVINTVSMSVLERTREIGTLRALGTRRGTITRLFALESALLGLLGSAFGILLTLLSWFLIGELELTFEPPDFSIEVPLKVHLVPAWLVVTGICLVALATLTAISPARRAAHASLVDALSHV